MNKGSTACAPRPATYDGSSLAGHGRITLKEHWSTPQIGLGNRLELQFDAPVPLAPLGRVITRDRIGFSPALRDYPHRLDALTTQIGAYTLGALL